MHRVEAANERKQREKKLASNPEELHKDEAMKKRIKREIKLESNPEELHKVEAMKRRTQREIELESNPEELHEIEAKSKRNQRNHNKTKINQIDRLRNFKRSVFLGPIFVCSSCHVKHFESNVTIVDEDFKAKLFENILRSLGVLLNPHIFPTQELVKTSPDLHPTDCYIIKHSALTRCLTCNLE